MAQNQFKIRVWHKKFRKFLSKDEWFLDFDGNLYFNDIIDRVSCGLIKCSPKLYVIQRFTGFLDKNQREIYEGDIVRHFKLKYRVVWCDWFGKYRIECPYFKTYKMMEMEDLTNNFAKSIEIQGDIFNNPDLLKSTK